MARKNKKADEAAAAANADRAKMELELAMRPVEHLQSAGLTEDDRISLAAIVGQTIQRQAGQIEALRLAMIEEANNVKSRDEEIAGLRTQHFTLQERLRKRGDRERYTKIMNHLRFALVEILDTRGDR